MPIPQDIVIMGGPLPPEPGVYFMKDARGRIMYVGKATSLRTRVSSYFSRPQEPRIAAMAAKVRRIDYERTPTAVEALMLEARTIKKLQPPYNVMEKDDKSFVHLVFTKEPFPRPVLIRAYELARMPKKQFLRTFGPFRSAASVRAGLDALRRSFPWTTCAPGRKRPCFYRHLGLCPGVCSGEISSIEYKKIVRELTRFFSGGRAGVVRAMRAEMRRAAKGRRFEEAAALRDRLFALEHIRDAAVMKREEAGLGEFIDVFGRIEGYDISNISGTDAVGSMVVFEDGEPKKKEYRKFAVRTVQGPNDAAMLGEVLRRRFAHHGVPSSDYVGTGSAGAAPGGHATQGRSRGATNRAWRMPELVLVDGGASQVNEAKRVLADAGLRIPLVGMAKGRDRKRDELVYDRGDYELSRLAVAFRPLLQRVRDEAHRFAVAYHRDLRGRSFISRVE